jgi:threonine dehydrogenase-like Zn-dependent dehydrogenase
MSMIFGEFMKAAILYKPGSPLSVEETPKPEMSSNDVLIKMKAAAICPSDLPIVLGQHMETRGYNEAYLKRNLPHISGHENAGVVEEVGKDVKALSVGDRVITIPSTSCGECFACNIGRDNICLNSTWTGKGPSASFLAGPPGGGWAEYMVSPAKSAFKLPDNVSFEEATIITAGAPGFHGTVRAGIRDSDTVLVFGAGAVGLYAMHYAKIAHGASMVIGVDIMDARLDFAKKYFDVDYTINAQEEDVVKRVKELTPDRNGADVAIEAVGYTEKTVEQAIQSLRLGGTLVHVGSHPEAPKNYGGWKELQHIFALGYARDDYRKMLRHAGSGKMELAKAVTNKIKLEDVNEGVQTTENKTGNSMRVVITKF